MYTAHEYTCYDMIWNIPPSNPSTCKGSPYFMERFFFFFHHVRWTPDVDTSWPSGLVVFWPPPTLLVSHFKSCSAVLYQFWDGPNGFGLKLKHSNVFFVRVFHFKNNMQADNCRLIHVVGLANHQPVRNHQPVVSFSNYGPVTLLGKLVNRCLPDDWSQGLQNCADGISLCFLLMVCIW